MMILATLDGLSELTSDGRRCIDQKTPRSADFWQRDFFLNSNVISKKIQIKHPFLRTKSFAASLAVHSVLFLAIGHFIASNPVILEKPENRVVIALNDFTEKTGDIHRLESRASLIPAKKDQQHVSHKHDEPLIQHIKTPDTLTKTLQETPSSTPSVSPEASAPLAQIPMPASSLPSDSIDSPQSFPSPPVHELPKAPIRGNDIGGAALGHIRAMIEKAVVYPSIARKMRLEGMVTVFFILNPDGTVEKANIIGTSGSKILDDKALSTILNLSGDYPVLGKTVELRIPIAFNLS